MKRSLREEKKYRLGINEAMNNSDRLEKVLKQDSHNGSNGYIIRSLYYDTPYDNDFFEKQAGVELRRKVRLRVYDPDDSFAMLELKQKQGSKQLKRSLKISRDDAEKIAKCDYSPLLKYNDSFAVEMYALMNCKCYRPCAIVQYYRKAFIADENDTRITFDSQITATESCLDIFSNNLNLNPVLDSYDVILEVKYNGFLLSYIKDILASIDKSEIAVSKYVLSRHNAYFTHI